MAGIILATLVACGGNARGPVQQVSVAVAPATSDLRVRGALALKATVAGSTDQSVTWAVLEPGGGSISPSGIYTAPSTVGTYHVQVTSRVDTSKTATATITVSPYAGRFVALSAYKLDVQSAALLSDGKVLLVTASKLAVFDPASNEVAAVQPALLVERKCNVSAALPGVRGLIAGGETSHWEQGTTVYDLTDTTELYPGGMNSTTPGPTMSSARSCGQAATSFADGTVLLSGGSVPVPGKVDPFYGELEYCRKSLNSADLFRADLVTRTTAIMSEKRRNHTATALTDNRVLVTGGIGCDFDAQWNCGCTVSASSEIYDPARDLFTATGALNIPRHAHSAVRLPDGTVLISGGFAGMPASLELYEPSSGTFTLAGSMLHARAGHSSTLLNDGTVLLAGGAGAETSAEVFDPVSKVSQPTGSLPFGLDLQTAILLPSGRVLIVGVAVIPPLGCSVCQPAPIQIYE